MCRQSSSGIAHKDDFRVHTVTFCLGLLAVFLSFQYERSAVLIEHTELTSAGCSSALWRHYGRAHIAGSWGDAGPAIPPSCHGGWFVSSS
jgi:hypothetical protein